MGDPGCFETPARVQVLENGGGHCHEHHGRQGCPASEAGLHRGPDDYRQDLKGNTRYQNGDDPDEANQDRDSGEKVVCFQMSPDGLSAGACDEVGNRR